MLKADSILYGIKVCGIGAAIVILFYCIGIPVITKLGIEKSRIVLIVVYMVPFFIGFLIYKAIKEGTLKISASQNYMIKAVIENAFIILPLVILIAVVISYSISVKIYRKKEF